MLNATNTIDSELLDRIQSELDVSAVDMPTKLFSSRKLAKNSYTEKARFFRKKYQLHLLNLLKDKKEFDISQIEYIAEKLAQMSSDSSVARLWWVAGGFANYIKNILKSDDNNKTQVDSLSHAQIFSQLDEQLKFLSVNGEEGDDDKSENKSARLATERLVKTMLAHIGEQGEVGNKAKSIISAFGLSSFFPVVPENINNIFDKLDGLTDLMCDEDTVISNSDTADSVIEKTTSELDELESSLDNILAEKPQNLAKKIIPDELTDIVDDGIIEKGLLDIDFTKKS